MAKKKKAEEAAPPAEAAAPVHPSDATGYMEHARGISPHISAAQFNHPEWKAAYDPEGCPPDKPFHSTSKGGDSACVEKPDNCPEGKTAWGQEGECVVPGSRPNSGGPGQPGGPPGGPEGPGGPGGPGIAGGEDTTGDPYANWWANQMMGQRGQGAQMSNVARDQYLAIMGKRVNPETGQIEATGSSAALSGAIQPDVSAMNEIYAGKEKELMASLPEGGQKEQALNKLRQSKLTTMSGLAQQAVQGATGQLQDMGAQGQYWTDPMTGQVMSAGVERRGQDVTRELGLGNIGVQRELGQGQLGLGYGELGERGRQFDVGTGQWGQQFGFEHEKEGTRRGEFGASLGEQQRQYNETLKDQQKARKGQFLKSLVGGLVSGGAGFFSGGFSKGQSDIRLKEDIRPTAHGLSELRKLPIYDFDYNGKGGTERGLRTTGIMAQDLEKVAPEAVVEGEGRYKHVNLYSLIGITMQALKELDKKVAKKRWEK